MPPKRGATKKQTTTNNQQETSEEARRREAARDVVVRSDRVDLEKAIVELVAKGHVSVDLLTSVGGLAPAPRRRETTALEKGEAAKRATLAATGEMGSMERLGTVELECILQYADTVDRFSASEVCKGLLSLRGSARIWHDFDLSTLSHPTFCGVRRLLDLLDLSRLRSLTLGTAKGTSKDPISAGQYQSLCATLTSHVSGKANCGGLRYLALRAKRFGDSDKTLLAAKSLATSSLRGLDFGELKGARLEAVLELTSAAEGLECLKVDSYQLQWRLLLTRLAGQARSQRGEGARSTLRRLHATSTWSGYHVDLMPVAWIFQHFAESFPEIRELTLATVAEMPYDTPARPPTLTYLRVLRLRQAHFFEHRVSRALAAHTPMASSAATTYFARVADACPSLVIWDTVIHDPYIMRKDWNQGARPPAPPTVQPGALAGRSYPHLDTLTLVGFVLDAHSFDGLDAPALRRLRFCAPKISDLTPRQTRDLATAIATNLRGDTTVDVSHDDKIKSISYLTSLDDGW